MPLQAVEGGTLDALMDIDRRARVLAESLLGNYH
jgi:hypothetical protein